MVARQLVVVRLIESDLRPLFKRQLAKGQKRLAPVHLFVVEDVGDQALEFAVFYLFGLLPRRVDGDVENSIAPLLNSARGLLANPGKLDRLGIVPAAGADLRPRAGWIAHLLFNPAQTAQKRPVAKVEYVGNVHGLRHEALAEHLELGDLKVRGRQGFEPQKAHETGGDSHIHHRFLVLSLKGDSLPDQTALAARFGLAVIDEDFVALQKVVLGLEIRGRKGRIGVARKKLEPIDPKDGPQVEFDEQAKSPGTPRARGLQR